MSELFPYQVEGADFLSKRNFGLVADEMGLGKTIQAIRACDLVQAKRVLVICPASARINWQREFDKFSGINRSFTVVQTVKPKEPWNDSVICSYDLLDAIPKTSTFDVLIVDESHYLKTPTAIRTKLVLGKDGLIHRVKRSWFLSGTPAPNHAAELWPLLYSFGVTKLKFDAFIEEFCNYYRFDIDKKQITGTKVGRVDAIREMLKPHIIRRKKEDVMKELPPIYFDQSFVEPGLVDLEIMSSFTEYFFPINQSQRLFQDLENERQVAEAAFKTINVNGNLGINVLAALSESTATLRRYIGLQKVQPVAEMVGRELLEKRYDKVVIFGIHRDVIESLRIALKDFHPVTLYGGTPPEKRQKNIDRFQRTDKYRVFIGNIQAAGTAITLTRAHHVVFIEQSWVPGENLQAAMRCHRIGQTKTVTVRNVSLSDTLDEKITYAIQRKTRELAKIFDRQIREGIEELGPLPKEFT